MKRLLSFIMSIMLMLSLVLPAFAAEEASTDCPSIFIPGFSTSDICADKTDISTKYSFPSSDELLELVKNDLIPALVVYAADGDPDKVAHEISNLVNFIFKDFFNNPDGSAKGTSGAYMPYPEASSINKNSSLRFDYDWRGDPIVLAKELNDFIDYVLQSSGCDKVALRCHSLGSIVATSYISLYGNDKVMGMVFDSPALDGATYMGELLCGNTDVSGDALLQTLRDLLGENEYKEFITSTIDMLEVAGLHGMAGGFLDDLIDDIAPVIYEESLIPLFACWPTIWAMTPDEQIDEAMTYIFDNMCQDQDYSVLRGKIERYNTEVRANKKATLLNFDKVGKMAVIARYGFASIPVTTSWNTMTDSIIDTSSSSLGAVTAEFGTSFNSKYLEGKDMSLISPDRTVDASTCLFPEKTWFIKNLKHDRTDITKPLHIGLLFSEEEATCDNYDLPRFMIFDSETGTLSEDNTSPAEEVKLSPLERILNFLKAAIDFLLSLITGKQ